MDAVVLSQAGSVPPLTAEILLVFAIVAVALVLFVLEPLPIDIVALAVLVSLIVLEPWTGVDAETGVGGFASSATLTVLAMFVISEGIRRTGLINMIGDAIAERYGSSPRQSRNSSKLSSPRQPRFWARYSKHSVSETGTTPRCWPFAGAAT